MTAQSDYYEPHARFRLTRPIVIGGQIGCGARMIGRMLCARTGLPFVELDRQIEHEAGESLARLIETQGLKRTVQRTRAVLERLALQRPCAVVVLDRAWPGADSFHLFRRRLDFVHVERPTEFLLDRAGRELRAVGSGDDMPSVVRDKDDLKPIWDERTPLLSEARILLDAGERHELQVAEILMDALESVTSAQAL